ncbi:hypothetical protein SLA2020_289520 [Shorea laevis]
MHIARPSVHIHSGNSSTYIAALHFNVYVQFREEGQVAVMVASHAGCGSGALLGNPGRSDCLFITTIY